MLRPTEVQSGRLQTSRFHFFDNLFLLSQRWQRHYTGLFLPAATPKDIVNRVHAALLKVLDQPATRDAFQRLGAEVIKSTPEEVTRRMTSDIAKWRKVQQQTGIRID